jgi:hypothetical protein
VWRTTSSVVCSRLSCNMQHATSTYTCSYRAERTIDATCHAHAGITATRRNMTTQRDITTIRCNVTRRNRVRGGVRRSLHGEQGAESQVAHRRGAAPAEGTWVPELLTASAGTTDLRLCSLGLCKYSRTDLRPLGALSRSLASSLAFSLACSLSRLQLAVRCCKSPRRIRRVQCAPVCCR